MMTVITVITNTIMILSIIIIAMIIAMFLHTISHSRSSRRPPYSLWAVVGIGPACCEGLARVAKVLIRASGLGIYDLSLFFLKTLRGV